MDMLSHRQYSHALCIKRRSPPHEAQRRERANFIKIHPVFNERALFYIQNTMLKKSNACEFLLITLL
jgi:hypothetical protein